MTNIRLFDGEEYELVIYNGQAITDKAIRFYTVDCEGTETDYDFPGYASSFLRVYNERNGRELLELALSLDAPYLIINASSSDMTFEDNGDYFYEIGYNDGYDKVLRYGKLKAI